MEKIVCTGYGVIAPGSANIDQFLVNLQNGNCGLEVVENEGPKNESNIVGKIKEGLEEIDSDKQFRRFPRVTRLGMAAAREAVRSAGLHDLTNKKIGLFLGVSVGAVGEPAFQEAIINTHLDNYRSIPVTFTHLGNYHSITAAIGNDLGTKGITKTISTGCTSSLEAIEDAMVYLNSGRIDIAVVGGADSALGKVATYGFAKTKVLPFNQSLAEGAVPFQENSSGYAMSEASGIIVLERQKDAVKRGAHIKGEVVEIISNNDGVYLFSLEETGEQMLEAMKEVTRGRTPDYVNSQALGIQLNDLIEKKCSERLFNHQVPYTSIKSMIGNPLGAVGVLQVISSLLSIQYGFIPPTIRTTTQGFKEMKIVTSTSFQDVKEVVVSNHGYGGNNACAYIRKYK